MSELFKPLASPETCAPRCAPLAAQKTRATPEAGGEKGRSYRRLRTRFRHDGFDYRQIAREDDAAIYEQSRIGCSGANPSYEVIRVRRREGFRIAGRFVEPAEVYPNSEAWGTDGFTVQDREAAFRKLREIVLQEVGTPQC